MSTNLAGSNFLFLMTSNNSAGGFTNYHIGTEVSTSIHECGLIVEIDVTLGVNDYWLVRSQLSTNGWAKPQSYIQEIPQSYNVIQNTTIKEYTNPATSQMTYLSIRNNTQSVVSFINGGGSPNPWRMCLTNTNYNAMFGGAISFVFAPNTSTPSYFEISKTATYDVEVVWNQTVLTIGGINSYFNVNLYNITDSTIVGFCAVYFNNTSAGLG